MAFCSIGHCPFDHDNLPETFTNKAKKVETRALTIAKHCIPYLRSY
jgi:hypothetical protein